MPRLLFLQPLPRGLGILEFLGNSRILKEFLGNSGFYLRNSKLAVAAVKTRLQGREVIFWNFGVGLAVGHRSGSVQASFAPIFQASR